MQQQWRQPRDPHCLSADEVLKALGTTMQFGLSGDEVKRRLGCYGRNELQGEQPKAAWLKFLDQFANTLVALLIVAAVISAGLWFHESRSALPYEAIAIFVIVLCFTINFKAYTELSREIGQNEDLNSQVDEITSENLGLQEEIYYLQNDSETIKREAKKFGFRAKEKKVPVPVDK